MRTSIQKNQMRSVSMLLAAFMITALSGCGSNKPGTSEHVVQENNQSGTLHEEADAAGLGGVNVKFPETYKIGAGNVQFDCDVTVSAGADGEALRIYTATATLKKIDYDKAFELLYSGMDDYEVYEYVEENECGESVATATYVTKDETVFSFGPISSQLSFSRRNRMPHVLSAFRLDESSDDYNAMLYSVDGQLGFKDRQTVYHEISELLQNIGAGSEYEYKAYALDYQTLEQEEYHINMEGAIDHSLYKADWTQADDCYYVVLRQRLDGIPVYHVYAELFAALSDGNAPIQILVSADGIERLHIERVFEFTDLNEVSPLVEFDDIAQAVAEKYNKVLGGSSYLVKSAELNYYVNLSSGKGTYSVRPCWIFKGTEMSDGANKPLQVIIDAITCEEILP